MPSDLRVFAYTPTAKADPNQHLFGSPLGAGGGVKEKIWII